MLLYLFFDSLLSTKPKKMETEKWPKAADSPLQSFFRNSRTDCNCSTNDPLANGFALARAYVPFYR